MQKNSRHMIAPSQDQLRMLFEEVGVVKALFGSTLSQTSLVVKASALDSPTLEDLG